MVFSHTGRTDTPTRGEPLRAKFRNSFEHPEPVHPGQIIHLQFAMPDVYHRFGRGHRIMIQIQSSWFPLVDRNPQTCVEIPHAKPADFVRATERVYHSQQTASSIGLQSCAGACDNQQREQSSCRSVSII
jgi:predicted acyl esterase